MINLITIIKKRYILTFIIIMSFTIEHGQNLQQNNTGLVAQQNSTDSSTYLQFCSQINASGSNTAFGVFLILMMAIGTLGNAFILTVIARDRQLRSQVINWFFFSLAISDIVASLINISFRAQRSFYDDWFCLGTSECYLFIYGDLIFNTSSIICLVYISINRYFAVSHPLTHSSYISRKRAACMIIFDWCFSIILSIFTTINWKTGKLSLKVEGYVCYNDNGRIALIFLTLAIIIPLILMGILYMGILRILRRRRRKCQHEGGRSVMRRTEWKVTKTAVMVYSVFCICLLPFYVYVVVSEVCGKCFLKTPHHLSIDF